ncbi:MAG TPA: hypothetical protein VMR23_06030 [Candidatus Limnocylindria bacterium]|nr:hypothetical protein [Candidatus Limnocylindria bacterium]
MRGLLVFAFALAVVAPGAVAAERTPEAARVRVDHHLREVRQLSSHFEGVLAGECRRFASPAEWNAYVDAEVERVVLLMAHMEEAWSEAKQTGDDDVRRHAKTPRRQKERARTLLDKMQRCASDNGADLSPMTLWQRIEHEVPQRRAEIALPQ